MAFQVVVSLLGDALDLPAAAPCARAGGGSAARRSCSAQLWHQLRDYNRPDFHPDDRDTTELVERWRAELFGADGTLNDKLATTAA